MSKDQGQELKEKKQEGAGSSESEKKSRPKAHHKEREVAPGHCRAVHCKKSSNRFEFCDEHFQQFKFGLLKKNGDPVPDYEKKLEHYHAFQERRVHKAA